MNKKNNKSNNSAEQFYSSVSTNIEKILIKASLDEKFKESLLNNRKSILDMEEFSLNKIDKMLLTTIPSEKLEDMIEKITNQYMSRRNFLKGAAASVALLTGLASTISSCCPVPVTGARPEPPLVSETILPEGNTIDYSYSGLKIVIPPGTMDKKTNISISVITPPATSPEGITFFGEVYNISGEFFKKDISIIFPYSGKKEGIKAYSLEQSKWKEIPLEFKQEERGRYVPVVKTKKIGIYTLGCKKTVPSPAP
ncbi:MAG: twin-arginine translocation signal domain-containing protein [Candidatus Eremiobacterota bacterium]